VIDADRTSLLKQGMYLMSWCRFELANSRPKQAKTIWGLWREKFYFPYRGSPVNVVNAELLDLP
jgi:hypothetical protein